MKNITYVFILLTLVLVSCKPYNAVKKVVVEQKDSLQIITKDNKTYIGMGVLPKLSTKSIVLTTESNEDIEIASSDIDHLLAWSADQASSQVHKFIYTPIKEYESFDPNNNNKNIKERPRWLLRLCTADNMAMYVEHQEYDLKKEGHIHGNTIGVVSNPPSVWYYLRKDNKGIPTRIGLDASAGAAADKYFKNMGPKYFSDCPSLAEKIKQGTLDTKHIEDAMKEYNLEKK